MERDLFSELQRIGVDPQVAAKVSASLEPEYNATKKDILVLQEAILQAQVRSDQQHYTLLEKLNEQQKQSDERYIELKTEMVKGFSDVRSEISDVRAEVVDVRAEVANVRGEMGTMHRQYWITFGGLMTTIISVFCINWYFHM